MKKFTWLLLLLTVFGGTGVVCADLVDLDWSSGHLDVVDASVGDEYNELWIRAGASVSVYEGAIVGKVEFWDSSTGDIFGGNVDWLFAFEATTVDIYGGSFEWIGAWADSTINIHADVFQYHEIGGLENRSWIEGVFNESGESFSFTLYTDDAYSRINFIPEPATLLLFGIGGIIVRKRIV